MRSSRPAPFDPSRDHEGGRGRRRLVVVLSVGVVLLVVGAVLAVAALRGRDAAPVAGPTAGPSAPPSPTSEAGDPTTPGCEGGTDLRFDSELTAADGHTVPYSVSLPADYATSCREYPVLYALHGRDESNATFLDDAESMRAAVEDGVLDDVVIITPDSNLDGRWEGQYETDLMDELIPYVEETYRVQPGAAHRLLVGFSMGGHGAFRFGIAYPEEFAAVWSVDGAMSREPSEYLEFLDRVRAADPQIHLVGGNLNGDRVEEVVDLFAEQGVDFPYERLPLDHEFELFVAADRDAGWPTFRWLDEQLSAGG